MWSSNFFSQIEAAALTAADTGPLTAKIDGATVTLIPHKMETLGVSLERVEVTVPASDVDLTDVGHDISGRVTYLLEPLILLEVAAQGALLRSARPRREDTHADFYELWLRHEGESLTMTLGRVRHERETRSRASIPMVLTWEALGCLLDDLRVGLLGR